MVDFRVRMNEEVWGGGGSRSGRKGVEFEFERRVRAREDAEVIQGSFEFEFEDANVDPLSVCLCVVMLARGVSLTYCGRKWQRCLRRVVAKACGVSSKLWVQVPTLLLILVRRDAGAWSLLEMFWTAEAMTLSCCFRRVVTLAHGATGRKRRLSRSFRRGGAGAEFWSESTALGRGASSEACLGWTILAMIVLGALEQ